MQIRNRIYRDGSREGAAIYRMAEQLPGPEARHFSDLLETNDVAGVYSDSLELASLDEDWEVARARSEKRRAKQERHGIVARNKIIIDVYERFIAYVKPAVKPPCPLCRGS